jgi:hypothetical protein
VSARESDLCLARHARIQNPFTSGGTLPRAHSPTFGTMSSRFLSVNSEESRVRHRFTSRTPKFARECKGVPQADAPCATSCSSKEGASSEDRYRKAPELHCYSYTACHRGPWTGILRLFLATIRPMNNVFAFQILISYFLQQLHQKSSVARGTCCLE